MLELNALRLCLARNQAATLRSMNASLHTMEEAHGRGDRLSYARADTAFHNAFFDHCGSRHLVNAYNTVLGRIAAIRTHLSVPLAQEQRRSLKEHRAVVKAFAAGDLIELGRILDEHISRAKVAYAARLSAHASAPTQDQAGV